MVMVWKMVPKVIIQKCVSGISDSKPCFATKGFRLEKKENLKLQKFNWALTFECYRKSLKIFREVIGLSFMILLWITIRMQSHYFWFEEFHLDFLTVINEEFCFHLAFLHGFKNFSLYQVTEPTHYHGWAGSKRESQSKPLFSIVQIFWEGHKNLTHLSLFIWHYLKVS